MNDISIEYGHIYLDERIDSKRILETKKFSEVIHGINGSKSLIVMIDDYNPKEVNLDLEEYLLLLKDNNIYPDFVIFESELVKLSDEVFSLIKDHRIKSQYERYFRKNNHFPCSFLIATLYLLRFGVVNTNDKINFYLKNRENYTAKKLINVLQLKYKEVEEQAIKIIEATENDELLRSIEYIFVEGNKCYFSHC